MFKYEDTTQFYALLDREFAFYLNATSFPIKYEYLFEDKVLLTYSENYLNSIAFEVIFDAFQCNLRADNVRLLKV